MKKRATTKSLKGRSKDDQQGGSTVDQQARSKATTKTEGRRQRQELQARREAAREVINLLSER
jgi:hypothetical protein